MGRPKEVSEIPEQKEERGEEVPKHQTQVDEKVLDRIVLACLIVHQEWPTQMKTHPQNDETPRRDPPTHLQGYQSRHDETPRGSRGLGGSYGVPPSNRQVVGHLFKMTEVLLGLIKFISQIPRQIQIEHKLDDHGHHLLHVGHHLWFPKRDLASGIANHLSCGIREPCQVDRRLIHTGLEGDNLFCFQISFKESCFCILLNRGPIRPLFFQLWDRTTRFLDGIQLLRRMREKIPCLLHVISMQRENRPL